MASEFLARPRWTLVCDIELDPCQERREFASQDVTEPGGKKFKLSPVRAEPSLSFGPGPGPKLGIGEVETWP